MAEFLIHPSDGFYFGGSWPTPSSSDSRYRDNPEGIEFAAGESIRANFWFDIAEAPFTLDQVTGWGLRMRTTSTIASPPYLHFQWMLDVIDPGTNSPDAFGFNWDDPHGAHEFVVYSTDADGVGGFVVQQGAFIDWVFSPGDPSYSSPNPDWPLPADALHALLTSLQSNGQLIIAIDNASTPSGAYILNELAVVLFYPDVVSFGPDLTASLGDTRQQFF